MPRVRPGSARVLSLLATLWAAGCVDLVHNDPPVGDRIHALLADPGPGTHLDVALALGCPADDETGALSPCQACRVHAVMKAWRDGEVDRVIMSGGAAHNRFIEAEVMGRAAVALGLPEEALILEPRALTTWMNLRFSKRLMRQHGLRTALVISTKNHLPRAKRFVEWYGIPARYMACDLEHP